MYCRYYLVGCFQFCRTASPTAARFFPLDWRCCWINQPIILLSLTPPDTPHGNGRPVAGPNLHPASHLPGPPLAQDAPAGRISQVTVSDTLVIRLVFHLFWDSIQGWKKKIEVLWGKGLKCWLWLLQKATLFTLSFKTSHDSFASSCGDNRAKPCEMKADLGWLWRGGGA